MTMLKENISSTNNRFIIANHLGSVDVSPIR